MRAELRRLLDLDARRVAGVVRAPTLVLVGTETSPALMRSTARK